MMLLAEYIHKTYPARDLYLITQADCKQCVDVSNLFRTDYHKISRNTAVVENMLIMDNIGSIDSKKLMHGHENDIVLVFNMTYYAYSIFIKHVAASYPDKELTFFSDQDSWGGVSSNVKGRASLTYKSYRIGPLLLDPALLNYSDFSDSYQEIYHAKPNDSVSYMNYLAIMSAIVALDKFKVLPQPINMREKIFQSYLAALKKDPNWFKVNDYGIYQLTPYGEILVERLPKLKPKV